MGMGGNTNDSTGIPTGMRVSWEYDEHVSCFGYYIMVIARGIMTWEYWHIVFVCV